MPLTEKGQEIEGAMEKEYGEKKGESVFYASRNKGTISGVDAAPRVPEYSPSANTMSQSFRSIPEYKPTKPIE